MYRWAASVWLQSKWQTRCVWEGRGDGALCPLLARLGNNPKELQVTTVKPWRNAKNEHNVWSMPEINIIFSQPVKGRATRPESAYLDRGRRKIKRDGRRKTDRDRDGWFRCQAQAPQQQLHLHFTEGEQEMRQEVRCRLHEKTAGIAQAQLKEGTHVCLSAASYKHFY